MIPRIHVFRHKNKKLDVAYLGHEKYVNGSEPQGYEKMAGPIGNIKSMMKLFNCTKVEFQDDTKVPSVVCELVCIDKKYLVIKTEKKPTAPYVPKSKTVKKVASFV